MKITLHDSFKENRCASEAADLLEACVHCGFCLATCPTYVDNRDERDSPRGRIYLIKEFLETGEASTESQQHLDRCLTCRSCETTCPSGVQYGALSDRGRFLLESAVPRSIAQRSLRAVLRGVLSRPGLLKPLVVAGQWLQPILPPKLARKVPRRQDLPVSTAGHHARRMLIAEGCVQAAATPATSASVRMVLEQLKIEAIAAPSAGCCGAVNYHLAAHDAALENARRNIDAWWPQLQAGAEAIISSASGCGTQLADYGELLAHDQDYADKAAQVSAAVRDISEILENEDLSALRIDSPHKRIAIQTPCSLQHGLKRADALHTILQGLGFTLTNTFDDHLCCGSAGTYSILQRDISARLRENKLRALQSDAPDVIVSANVGCQLHLDEIADVPVVHWIELISAGITNQTERPLH
ncbi:MAG: glycolate oxidase subunit GlcF [Halioglobus sp.]